MSDQNLQMNRCLDVLLNTVFYLDRFTVLKLTDEQMALRGEPRDD
jgi:hypothetical protein